ncbi:hypothetical protein KKC1_32230, partial [Calderihabitans maritimus]
RRLASLALGTGLW